MTTSGQAGKRGKGATLRGGRGCLPLHVLLGPLHDGLRVLRLASAEGMYRLLVETGQDPEGLPAAADAISEETGGTIGVGSWGKVQLATEGSTTTKVKRFWAGVLSLLGLCQDPEPTCCGGSARLRPIDPRECCTHHARSSQDEQSRSTRGSALPAV